MSQVFDFFFSQYAGYETVDIVLEITAVVFGLASVWYSKQNNILVYPTGIVSTLIFVYLLIKWELLGDLLINAYYFIMSVYGWYIWTRKKDGEHYTPITKTTSLEQQISAAIFVGSIILVMSIYHYFDKFNSWTAYVDTLTTAIFFSGMWLMAKKKIENWIFWIIGDLISVPLYFYKGLTFSSFQYLVFTILAIFGYLAWKDIMKKELIVEEA